jgi:hypothetical protein
MRSLPRRLLTLLGCGLAVLAAVGASSASEHARPTARHAGGNGVVSGGRGAANDRSTPRPPAPIPLSTGWSYLADPTNVGVQQSWGQGGAAGRSWTPVSIPNDFNPTVSSLGDQGTVGWYQLRFTGPAVSSGRSWNVAFESVRRNAQAWLNGYPIGGSSDPYAPFSLPARGLVPGGSNLLIVRVDNFRGAGSLPEDWWNWGGIMGPVALQPSGRLVLRDLGVTPELGCGNRCGDLLVQGLVVSHATGALTPEISVRITSPAGVSSVVRRRLPRLRSGGARGISFRIPVHGPLALWSPTSPSLYNVEVQTAAQGRVEQDDKLRTGLRSVYVRGGILYLNGHRLWLHGAAIHEDLAGVGAALSDGDIDTIVSELRSVGANITRSHYLLSERLLEALDAAGIMVWAQPPVDHADAALRTSGGRARALGLLRSTLIGDRSHPSVIVDSVGNELTPTPDSTRGTRSYLQQAIPLARALDPGVPVALDIYCYTGFPKQRIYSQLDVLGISSYFGWYTGTPGHSIANFAQLEPFLRQSHARYPHQALVISEFGAEALYDGSATIKGTYEFQSNYLQQTFGVLDRLPFMNGAIYWTLREFAVSPGWTGGAQLPPGSAPDGVHHKGLITYDGSDKPAFAVAQQLFSVTPGFVH